MLRSDSDWRGVQQEMHISGSSVINSTVPRVAEKQGVRYSSSTPTLTSIPVIELDTEQMLKAELRSLISSVARADEIVEAYAQLVRFYLNEAQYDNAEQVLEEVLSYGRESYGAQHPAVAPLFIELAFVNYHRDNFIKAKLLLETALFIQEQAYGEVSEQAAFVLHKLGRVQEALNNAEEAEAFYLQSVTVYQNTYSEDEDRKSVV